MIRVPDFFAGLPKDVLLMIPMESDVRSRMRGVNRHLRLTLPEITEKRFRERRMTDARKCYYACINNDCELASFFLRRCGSVKFDYSEQFRVFELDDDRDPKDESVHLSLSIVNMLQPHYKRDPKFFDNIALYCMYMFPYCNGVLAWIASNHTFTDLGDVFLCYFKSTVWDHDDTYPQRIVAIIQFLLSHGMEWQPEFIDELINVKSYNFASQGMMQMPEFNVADYVQRKEVHLEEFDKGFLTWCVANNRFNQVDDQLYDEELDLLAQIQQEITNLSY